MAFIYSMTDTWNAIGTTFNGIYMNISDGAGGAPVGAAASRALRLDANGTSIFDVSISGVVALAAGTASAPTLALNSVPTFGMYFADSNNFVLTAGGIPQIDLTSIGIQLSKDNFISWTSTTNAFSGSRDTFLYRGAAGLIGVNGVSVTEGAFTNDTAGIKFRRADNSQPTWVKVEGMTLASLPTPASAGNGARMYITDATLPLFNTTVSGGGSTGMVVFSNGTNWKCG